MKNSLPYSLAKKRYHDLDALRAFAMLLGIGLHGFMSFVPFPLPVWSAQDVNQHEGYLFALHAIHGFRLQLFFLVSGFFTAMMFRQRGLRGLIKHRAKRILLPLVIFTILLSPTIIGIGIYGSALNAKRGGNATLWAAAKSGDVEAINRHLAKGADVSQPDAAGLTPLSWAALLGQADAAGALIDGGADLEAADSDGTTALHCAAFMGESAVARLLVEHGADVNAASDDGGTPLSATEADELTTQFIAGMLQIPVDEKKMATGRAEIAKFLKAKGALPRHDVAEDPLAWLYLLVPGFEPIAGQLPEWAQAAAIVLAVNWLLAMIPIFAHLWFLYYLVLLVAGFAVVTWVARKLNWKPVPAWFVASPLRLLWLVPLTFVPQFFMVTDLRAGHRREPHPLAAHAGVLRGLLWLRRAVPRAGGVREKSGAALAGEPVARHPGAAARAALVRASRQSFFYQRSRIELPDLLANHLLCYAVQRAVRLADGLRLHRIIPAIFL